VSTIRNSPFGRTFSIFFSNCAFSARSDATSSAICGAGPETLRAR
jgi:hypothetical protein